MNIFLNKHYNCKFRPTLSVEGTKEEQRQRLHTHVWSDLTNRELGGIHSVKAMTFCCIL